MSQSNLTLASLIGSRICHDLISPIGAIGNGLELIEMGASGGMVSLDGPEMDLITQSVKNANDRIRFFRVAFGIASENQIMSHTEIQKLLDGVTSGGRIIADWHPSGDFQRKEVKAIFLAFQCLESAMAFGGHVAFSKEDTSWQITASGDNLKTDAALWEMLKNPTDSYPAPANVQFALLRPALADVGRLLQQTVSPKAITLRF